MRNHDEIRDLLGAFALDAVDGEEFDTVDVHLRYCAQCRAEVAEYREVAGMIGHGGAPAPEGVWDRIVEALEPAPPRMRISVDETGTGTVVPLPPKGASGLHRSIPSRVFIATLAAAAVIVAVLGLVIVRLADETTDPVATRSDLQELADAALVDPDVRTAQLRSEDDTLEAEAAVGPEGQGFLLAGGLPQLPDENTYQLWGVVGEETISLGTFKGGVRVVPFRVDPAVAVLAVTKERAGGVAVSQNPLLMSGDVTA